MCISTIISIPLHKLIQFLCGQVTIAINERRLHWFYMCFTQKQIQVAPMSVKQVFVSNHRNNALTSDDYSIKSKALSIKSRDLNEYQQHLAYLDQVIYIMLIFHDDIWFVSN